MNEQNAVSLGLLTWPEAAQREEFLLAVPLGSTEQHGPHLPLDTDARIAAALAEALARRHGDVLTAPVLAYGSSGEHAGFAGTLSIGGDALELIIVELVRSACQSFRGVVLVSWHGGNAEPVARAVRQLVAEGRQVMTWSPRYVEGDAHAGRTETSLMLAIAPHLVRRERAEAGNTAPVADLMDSLRTHGVRASSPNGVLGDPRGASASEGEQLLCHLVDDLSQQVESKLKQGVWR